MNWTRMRVSPPPIPTGLCAEKIVRIRESQIPTYYCIIIICVADATFDTIRSDAAV